MLNTEPRRSRPLTQKEYGVPSSEEGMLAWSWVVERLEAPRAFWLVTVSARGKPQASPVWGVWLAGDLYFGMGEQTRKRRNIAANPAVVIHLDSSDEVVVLEGQAIEVLEADLQADIDAAYLAKYDVPHGTPVFRLEPSKAFAWDEDYPTTATRWIF